MLGYEAELHHLSIVLLGESLTLELNTQLQHLGTYMDIGFLSWDSGKLNKDKCANHSVYGFSDARQDILFVFCYFRGSSQL